MRVDVEGGTFQLAHRLAILGALDVQRWRRRRRSGQRTQSGARQRVAPYLAQIWFGAASATFRSAQSPARSDIRPLPLIFVRSPSSAANYFTFAEDKAL
jgi:hypothetical protein